MLSDDDALLLLVVVGLENAVPWLYLMLLMLFGMPCFAILFFGLDGW